MIFMPISSSSAGNLYLLEDGDGHRLAIECGIRFAEMRQKLNYMVSELDGILLSHSHLDHARSLKCVLAAGVPVYALRKTFDAFGVAGLGVADHHNAHSVAPMAAFTIKGYWHVLPFELRHDVPALGFLVQAGEEKLLYITDTAYVPYRFSGLTLVAVEANYSGALLRKSDEAASRKMRSLRYHMSIERVLGFLAVNDLSAVREIHLLHLSDMHSDADLFKRLVEEATGKPVYVARAGGLGRRTPVRRQEASVEYFDEE
jgi:phosphoribosyl 1,2-cyclic phosphodiesterase